MRLSIVIPTLNAAESLPGTLHALGGKDEKIVVDAGSTDGTLSIAVAHGARVLQCDRGRGLQLAAGAEVASEEWRLFLHADTVLQPGWREFAHAFTLSNQNMMRAAAFRFRLDDRDWRARILEGLVALRAGACGFPYGDQGLLVHRDFYAAIGGFRPLPLMEDVDIVRRIGRRRMTILSCSALTSSARWRRRGWIRQSLQNQYCLLLYYLGVSPARIRDVYESW